MSILENPQIILKIISTCLGAKEIIELTTITSGRTFPQLKAPIYETAYPYGMLHNTTQNTQQ